ncbi:MAG TPA: iron ABC transporter permease [Acidimicrobiales bacterium]|nr:iron ABC transporter permease [Acidimicrobiales bacterium]
MALAVPAMRVMRRSPRRAPRVLVLVSVLVAAALLSPLVFLVLKASNAGWHSVQHLLFRRLTRVLLVNTVELAAAVSAACAVLGTAAAWVIERTGIPGRRAWAVLVVLPVAIPDFVVGYSWHSIAPAVQGLAGATLVMTLALYPLVYLPVAAALRRADPAEEEVARSLGLGPIRTFLSVTLRQVRPAISGGCLVVCLAMLAEYGAFEIVRFQTFTTTIFGELNNGFDPGGASGLSIVLVIIAMIVLAGEAGVSTRGRLARSAGQAAPVSARRPLRPRYMAVAICGMAVLAGLGLGMPIGTLVYWMAASHATTVPVASLWSALAHTAGYSAAAALVATVMALPVALLSVRFRSPAVMVLERSTYLSQCLPGIVVALALVYFAERYALRLYQRSPLLIAAYSVLYFPLALISVRTSVAQAPRRLEEVARSLGYRPLSVMARITLPLVAPGLAAGFCLVFLSAATELTATLLLVPTGVNTLATQFWAYQIANSYGAAAPYAVAIVALAAIPGYLLTTWFDRRPGFDP